MTDDILKQLAVFGLSPIDARVYVALVSSSTQGALDIARTLDVPRTSVYDALTRLAERGLIERVAKHKKTQYKAASIDMLDTIVAAEHARLGHMESSLRGLKEQLEAKTPHIPQTEIRYYKGAQGLRQLMWNSLKADTRGIVGYSVFGRASVVGVPFYRRYTAEFKKRGLSDRCIINPTKATLARVAENLKPNFHHMTSMNVRTLPVGELHITGDTMIYNDIYATSQWEAGEVVGVEIENPAFVKTQRSMFEYLWKQAQEFE